MTVAALAGVLCDPEWRGRGFGSAVVRAAFDLIDDGAFPCALYQTDVPRFYEKIGARQVSNRLVNSLANDPMVCPFWGKHAMIYPSSYPWPDGEIDTFGPGW